VAHRRGLLSDNPWLSAAFNGAKPRRRPGLPDQSLWFSKGETGQRVFDAVFAAWEKTPEAGAKTAICQPS
jgi:hypothetical protein